MPNPRPDALRDLYRNEQYPDVCAGGSPGYIFNGILEQEPNFSWYKDTGSYSDVPLDPEDYEGEEV